VTLLGLAGGECLTLPPPKGLAFPFLLTLDGYPTSPAIYAQGQGFSPKIKETPEQLHLDSLRLLDYSNETNLWPELDCTRCVAEPLSIFGFSKEGGKDERHVAQ